jgi:hypothetical protein
VVLFQKCFFLSNSNYFAHKSQTRTWKIIAMPLCIVTVAIVNIMVTLRLMPFLSMVWSLNQCMTRMPFDPIQGQRYTGPAYAVVSNIGPQKCISECISRKPRCKGVNYSRNRLSCEIYTSTEQSIMSDEYMRIDLEKVTCFPHQDFDSICTTSFWKPDIPVRIAF